jgi:hypothetical protein
MKYFKNISKHHSLVILLYACAVGVGCCYCYCCCWWWCVGFNLVLFVAVKL